MDSIFDVRQFPTPLPPNRRIELVRTKVDMVVPCAACWTRTASLTCSRCWAVRYCSKECQKEGGQDGKRGWKDHKKICNNLSKIHVKVREYAEKLVEEFGGAEEFFSSDLVKKGKLTYYSSADNTRDRYIVIRKILVDDLFWAGRENHGPLAFRLAAENMLDLMCLTYDKMRAEVGKRYTYCGWMVAAGMNQEALNFLYYFYRRKQSSQPLPYLDISKDEDVEGEDYLELMKRKKDNFEWTSDFQYHDNMLIALIKYKRVQELFVLKQKADAGWVTFLLGTDPILGSKSDVLKIGGKALVVERIKIFVFGEKIAPRIDQLAEQIQKLLTAVMEENPKIIPGVMDKSSIPYPYKEKDQGDEDWDGDRHEACVAYDNYASAWNMSPAYTKVLQLFLDTGRVIVDNAGDKLPVEGLLQAAFDVDPSSDLVVETDAKTTWIPKNLFPG